MSLARLAMRIAAARALRGATLAGPRVHDSAIAPIDQTIAEERQPILIVTTDDHEMEVTGRDLFHGNVSCDLVIEAAIAARVEVAGEESVITIPHTDEGMELALDLMEHQVMAALIRGRTPWSRVWMKLVPRISRRLSRRGASVEKGVRFAARQIVLTCDLIEVPTDGAAIAPGTAPSAAAYDDTTQIATTAQVHDTVTTVPERALTGTSYTLVLSDAGKLVTLNNAAAITLTIPTNTAVAFPVGTRIDLLQYGAGQVTVGGSGVTIRSSGSKLKLAGQYSGATLWKRGTNEWVLIGDIAT